MNWGMDLLGPPLQIYVEQSKTAIQKNEKKKKKSFLVHFLSNASQL